MPSRRKHPLTSPRALPLALLAALQLYRLFLPPTVTAADRPVFYLVDTDANTPRFSVPTAQTRCPEPNLVVITHGWYERQPWPGWTAQAITQKVDRRHWRCGWYDWRRLARCWRPSQSATMARDTVGPQLGYRIVRLSRNWRHVHLIGHSAGSWAVNAAAEIIATETQASIHITFLDAYVPDGWKEEVLARIAGRSPSRCWADHYFTRDLLNFTEITLTHAHNVDVTAVNPGVKSHHFPWHWYHATVTGRYSTAREFEAEPLGFRTGAIAYGFARAREHSRESWDKRVALKLGNTPVRIEPEGPDAAKIRP